MDFHHILVIGASDDFCEIALHWMPWDFIDYDESTLVKVMAWCCQARSQIQIIKFDISWHVMSVSYLLFNFVTWVNISTGNGLLPDGTKPFPKPVFTYHQRYFMAFIWDQFSKKLTSKVYRDNHIISNTEKPFIMTTRQSWLSPLSSIVRYLSGKDEYCWYN